MSCGRDGDLQWVDESKLLVSSALSNTLPEKRTLQPTPLLITPSDLKSNHLSLYIQFECVENQETESEACENEVVDNTDKYCSVTTALMQKANHYPSVKIDNSGKNNIQPSNPTNISGLQSVGMMRQRMGPEAENIMKNLNNTEEIRKACQAILD